MMKFSHLPSGEQFSVLMATTLFAYALSRNITFPPISLDIPLPGIFISITINFYTIASLFIAGITAAGSVWLIHSHPFNTNHNIWQHIWLPALTAWVISTLLNGLPPSRLIWWVGLVLGGSLLAIVLIAEYISVDIEDRYYLFTAILLVTFAYSLYLILITIWHSMDIRLFILYPAIFISSLFVSLRVISLRSGEEESELIPALGIALVTAQTAAALNYWPLSSPRFGLLMVGIVYAFVSLIINLRNHRRMLYNFIDPAITLLILWGSAIWIS
jgi:hypothetical protein